VRGVTIGDAFHYMDRDQTLTGLDTLVAPGGFVALVVSHALGTPKPWWETVLDRIRDRYFGTHRHAGPDQLFHYQREDHESVLRRSAFSQVRVLRADQPLVLSLEELIGIQYTYSFSSHAVLKDRQQAWESDWV
jgi:hypothetical protein